MVLAIIDDGQDFLAMSRSQSAIYLFDLVGAEVGDYLFRDTQIREMLRIKIGRAFREIADYPITGSRIAGHFMMKLHHVAAVTYQYGCTGVSAGTAI